MFYGERILDKRIEKKADYCQIVSGDVEEYQVFYRVKWWNYPYSEIYSKKKNFKKNTNCKTILIKL